MILILDKRTIENFPHIIFTLEREDFVNELGHKLISDLKFDIQNEDYYTEKFKEKIVWFIDISFTKKLTAIIQKYNTPNIKLIIL